MPNKYLPSAFTKKYSGLIRDIVTDAGVSEPLTGEVAVDDSRIIKVQALWDTGATNSVISPRLVTQLNLQPSAPVRVVHSGGETMRSRYLIDLYLPNNVSFAGLFVTDCDDLTGRREDGTVYFDVIIGMDIITNGDFTLTNVGGKTTFNFLAPSNHDYNFVEELKEIDKRILKSYGRNGKCPCGSGKKVKECHGKGLF